MELINKIFKGDRSVWIIFMFLCFVSLVEVYSATSTLAYKNTYFWGPIFRHATFLAAGFGLIILLHNFPSRWYSLGIMLLPVSMVMLVVTLFIGVETNTATRWLSIFGFQFQPSEVAKLACIIFVAFMLSKQERFTHNRAFWIMLGGISLTCALIFTENFSTALLLFFVCFLMMFIGQASGKKMLLLFISMIFAGGLVLTAFHTIPDDFAKKYLPERYPTWRGRLDVTKVEKWGGSWFNEKSEESTDKEDKKFVLNENFQVNHAKIAIARGGLFGLLPGRSIQRDFLPQAYSDFIYAIIIEEMGLIFGGVGVLMLYVFLMFRVAIIARRCEKLFPKYLALGCGLMIVIQAFTNMAVAVDLFPVTGQPLPLISRGGTSTLFTCAYFGIILSVSRFGAGMDEDNENEGEIEDIESETIDADNITVEELADMTDNK